MSLKAIEEALSGLALRRQVDPLRGTFAAYAEDLARFNPEDVRQACRVIGSQPRAAGEKAFPDIGTLIAECERQSKNRHHVEPSQFMQVYQCGSCDNRQAGYKPAACIVCGKYTYLMGQEEKFDMREYVQDVRNHPENYVCIGQLEVVLRAKNMMPAGDAK